MGESQKNAQLFVTGSFTMRAMGSGCVKAPLGVPHR